MQLPAVTNPTPPLRQRPAWPPFCKPPMPPTPRKKKNRASQNNSTGKTGVFPSCGQADPQKFKSGLADLENPNRGPQVAQSGLTDLKTISSSGGPQVAPLKNYPSGSQMPLSGLADLELLCGPQMVPLQGLADLKNIPNEPQVASDPKRGPQVASQSDCAGPATIFSNRADHEICKEIFRDFSSILCVEQKKPKTFSMTAGEQNKPTSLPKIAHAPSFKFRRKKTQPTQNGDFLAPKTWTNLNPVCQTPKCLGIFWPLVSSPHHTFSAPTHSIFIHLPRNFTLFFLTYDLCWASKDFLTSCVLLSHLGSVAPDVGFFLSLFLAPRTLEGVSDIINNFCCPDAFGLISVSNDSPDDSLDF